jgi:hypothetical protein
MSLQSTMLLSSMMELLGMPAVMKAPSSVLSACGAALGEAQVVDVEIRVLDAVGRQDVAGVGLHAGAGRATEMRLPAKSAMDSMPLSLVTTICTTSG